MAVTLAVSSPRDYVAPGHCWLNVHTDTIWAFVGPVLFVLTVSGRPGGPEAWGGGTRQGGEALPPTDTRSPGQYLHPDPRGDHHRVQRPPPGPHAEPAARPAAADQGPDVVRPQAEGVRGKWGSEA